MVGVDGDNGAEEVNSAVCIQLLKLNQTTITLLVSAAVHHFFKQIFSDTVINQTVNNHAQSKPSLGYRESLDIIPTNSTMCKKEDDMGQYVGVGAEVIISLAELFKGIGYCLIYLSSDSLLQNGIRCVTTTRAHNRNWLQEFKSLMLDRGQHESVIIMVNNTFVWEDKKTVHSTCDRQTVTIVKCKQKDVAFYNKYTGGVDQLTQERKLYYCSQKTFGGFHSPESQLHWPTASSRRSRRSQSECSACSVGLCRCCETTSP